MHIQREFGMMAYRRDKLWTEGNVFYEVTIHHVQMDPVSTSFVSSFHLRTNLPPIGS
jgi:hypothetical protein